MSELTTGTDLLPAARREGDAVVASIHGEIDLHNSPELRDAVFGVLLRDDTKRLIFNLQGVPYMDSSGLAVLVESLKRMQKRGGKICLINLQPRVKGLLEIARLDTLFMSAASEQEALLK